MENEKLAMKIILVWRNRHVVMQRAGMWCWNKVVGQKCGGKPPLGHDRLVFWWNTYICCGTGDGAFAPLISKRDFVRGVKNSLDARAFAFVLCNKGVKKVYWLE